MDLTDADREFLRFKMKQAQEALGEAEGLLADGAELSYVVNSLYYAFYYPVLGLLHSRGTPAAMQSVSIALFEREFIQTGLVGRRFSDSLRRVFELKPKCSTTELKVISRPDVETLLADARAFVEMVGRTTGLA
jgi:uncharacterized protein (UPF0332 family)